MRKLVLSAAVGGVLILGILVWNRASTNMPLAVPERKAGKVPHLDRLREATPEFRHVELQAVGGSVEAANALMEYHSRCHVRDNVSPDLTPERFKQCVAKVAYWTQIALENGSPAAAQRHTNVLLQSRECSDIYRAEFWYSKFKRYYNSDRTFLKSVWDEIEEKKRTCAWEKVGQ